MRLLLSSLEGSTTMCDVNYPGSTCWTLIRGAASGQAHDRAEFARRYGGVVRAYFTARWRVVRDHEEVGDAAQAVFVECFKEGGVLDKAGETTTPDFRAFLFGVVRNVAQRFERNWANRRRGAPPSSVDLDGLERNEATLSEAFDRAWATSVVGEARALQEYAGQQSGEAATKRFELLRLRFQEGLAIRDIARRWGADPAWVHHEYKKARNEFEKALLKVVHFHHPGNPARAQMELSQVLSTLGSAPIEADGS